MTDPEVATCPIPHGVVFIYDPTASIDVPADTSAGPVLATKNCISIWVLGEYEGEVEVSFADQIVSTTCSLVFTGLLETPSRTIAFNTSACEPLIEVSVPTANTALSIYTNDVRDPTKVVCIVAAPRPESA